MHRVFLFSSLPGLWEAGCFRRAEMTYSHPMGRKAGCNPQSISRPGNVCLKHSIQSGPGWVVNGRSLFFPRGYSFSFTSRKKSVRPLVVPFWNSTGVRLRSLLRSWSRGGLMRFLLRVFHGTCRSCGTSRNAGRQVDPMECLSAASGWKIRKPSVRLPSGDDHDGRPPVVPG